MAQEIKKREYDDWLRFCERVTNSSNVPVNESSKSKQARIDSALTNYNYFVKTYLPVYADSDCAQFQIEAANEILDHEDLMGVLEWPREHAKSVHATIAIPMWLIAHQELTGMILVGKNETDACNLLSDIQAQLQYNELFANDFGQQFNFGSWEEGDFTTKEGIRFMAIGRDQSPRGARKNEKRPNLAVCSDIDDDEIVNNQKRVVKVVKKLKKALYGGLSIKKGGRFIVEGNRIHPQSILAHFVGDIKPGAPKNPEVWHSKVCATDGGFGLGNPAWPERYTLDELLRKFKKMGMMEAKAEYYHEHHIEGTIFKDSMIHWIAMPLSTWKHYKVIIGYFDPSFENKPTSDFKAVSLWALKVKQSYGYEKHCLKRFTRRCDLDAVYKWMSDIDDALPAGIGIIWYCEEQFFTRPIKEALKRHNSKRIATGKRQLSITIDTRTKEGKYTRIVKMEPEYSDGNVFYNLEEMHNPDMIEGNNQLKGIEPGYNSPDDAPDADEGDWYYLDQHLPTSEFTPVIRKQTRKNGW